MKGMFAAFALLCLAGSALAAEAEAPPPRPSVEVAFVLDTTGSMGGLIAGAKEKIWYIANQIALGKPTPIVRMALVAYRDKGDEYVTKVFDLTDNIDQVYTDLMGFQANGGGDTPENVNQAIHDAVTKLSWSKDRTTLRVIYLVGDSPPHNEYADVPTYDKLATAAIEKGINVNTVLCGGNTQTQQVWQEIARLADGSFLAIAQDGGVRQVATPFDADLAALNAKLMDTTVAYGAKDVRAKQSKLNTDAKSYAAPAAAERASFAATSGVAAGNDLLDYLRKGEAKLEEVKKDMLPENMQKMSEKERAEYVAKMQAEREKLNKQIQEISAKRNEFIKQKLSEDKGAKDGFDQQVLDVLKEQAAEKDIRYE
ncbi:MAG TPA: VWA domain-containing protein [Planctomycetota bacterium]|nr:VWA domain-containing protein [Planctomycetota bacterium]